jgi:hypothetical protein
MAKHTLGKLPPGAFGMLELPALARDLLDGFRELPDLTGTTSDVMDELGIVGAVPAAVLRPNDPRARVVGRALTVRNVRSWRDRSPQSRRARRCSGDPGRRSGVQSWRHVGDHRAPPG